MQNFLKNKTCFWTEIYQVKPLTGHLGKITMAMVAKCHGDSAIENNSFNN